jgi:plasmid stability protein
MVRLAIHDIDGVLLMALQRRAARTGREVEEEALAILRQVLATESEGASETGHRGPAAAGPDEGVTPPGSGCW